MRVWPSVEQIISTYDLKHTVRLKIRPLMFFFLNFVFLSHSAIRTPFGCKYDGPPISIFAARVHAHQWGSFFVILFDKSLWTKEKFFVHLARVNSLYRLRDNGITQIVKGDPQWPQSFYPLQTPIDIKKGDFVMGQCVYDNDEDRVIQVGFVFRLFINSIRCKRNIKLDQCLDRHITMKCVMFTRCIPSNRSTLMEIQLSIRFQCVGTMHSVKQSSKMKKWTTQSIDFIRCFFSIIPADSEVPPKKPDEMSQMKGQPHQHSEHAMNVQPGISTIDRFSLVFSSSNSMDRWRWWWWWWRGWSIEWRDFGNVWEKLFS